MRDWLYKLWLELKPVVAGGISTILMIVFNPRNKQESDNSRIIYDYPGTHVIINGDSDHITINNTTINIDITDSIKHQEPLK